MHPLLKNVSNFYYRTGSNRIWKFTIVCSGCFDTILRSIRVFFQFCLPSARIEVQNILLLKIKPTILLSFTIIVVNLKSHTRPLEGKHLWSFTKISSGGNFLHPSEDFVKKSNGWIFKLDVPNFGHHIYTLKLESFPAAQTIIVYGLHGWYGGKKSSAQQFQPLYYLSLTSFDRIIIELVLIKTIRSLHFVFFLSFPGVYINNFWHIPSWQISSEKSYKYLNKTILKYLCLWKFLSDQLFFHL